MNLSDTYEIKTESVLNFYFILLNVDITVDSRKTTEYK